MKKLSWVHYDDPKPETDDLPEDIDGDETDDVVGDGTRPPKPPKPNND